jgi:hypothetical protein
MLSIVPAARHHLGPIAGAMRDADREEVKAASGLSPEVALAMSFEVSTRCWTALDGDTPFIMFGVAPFPGLANTGSPWLLGTPHIVEHPAFFLRNSRPIVSQMLDEYTTLINYVDCRNRLSVRWLQWCGFHLVDYIHEFGVARIPFYQFSFIKG